jgi:hypothetical protein
MLSAVGIINITPFNGAGEVIQVYLYPTSSSAFPVSHEEPEGPHCAHFSAKVSPKQKRFLTNFFKPLSLSLSDLELGNLLPPPHEG